MSNEKPPNRAPVVEVTWVDSVSARGWRDRTERLEEMTASDLEHRTAGYLLRRDKSGVVITHSLGDYLPNVAETIHIPRAAVTSLTVLKKA